MNIWGLYLDGIVVERNFPLYLLHQAIEPRRDNIGMRLGRTAGWQQTNCGVEAQYRIAPMNTSHKSTALYGSAWEYQLDSLCSWESFILESSDDINANLTLDTLYTRFVYRGEFFGAEKSLTST